MQDFFLYGGIAVGVLTGLWGVGVNLINRMAADEEDDGWDDAKEVVDQIAPYVEMIERWADPDDELVPESPLDWEDEEDEVA